MVTHNNREYTLRAIYVTFSLTIGRKHRHSLVRHDQRAQFLDNTLRKPSVQSRLLILHVWFNLQMILEGHSE